MLYPLSYEGGGPAREQSGQNPSRSFRCHLPTWEWPEEVTGAEVDRLRRGGLTNQLAAGWGWLNRLECRQFAAKPADRGRRVHEMHPPPP
jgi:hypothetical protein